MLTLATSNPSDQTKRGINLAPVQVSLHVPKYQPANLQLWENNGVSGGGPITPANLFTGNNLTYKYNFPEGYVAHQRIAATANPNVTPNPNDTNTAYREFYVYTGVPVDMSTSISNNVTDVGTVQHGFGVQMGGQRATWRPTVTRQRASPPTRPIPASQATSSR